MSLISSETVERACSTVAQRVEAKTAAVFRQCLTDTLAATIEELPDGTALVVTGDTPAMRLRDFSAQLTAYLLFLSEDPLLATWSLPCLADSCSMSFLTRRGMHSTGAPAGQAISATALTRTCGCGSESMRSTPGFIRSSSVLSDPAFP
jgi:hypothetical protein